MIEIKHRANIKTIELEYNYSDDVSDEHAEDQKDEVGIMPIVYINKQNIDSSNINLLKIYNNKIYPMIELEFYDATNEIIMKKYLPDESIISVFKKSTSSILMDIRMDFKVTEVKIITEENNKQKIKLVGIININGLFLYNIESYDNSSYNTLDELSKDMELGFSSNISDTNDKMVWLNPSEIRLEFIKNIIEHSYIDDTTYLFGYIDFYYNFNYIDINKQINSNISEQMNIDEAEQITKTTESNEPVPLILTNHDNNTSTNMYISKYNIIQDSTKNNINLGYRYKYNIFNKSKNDITKYNIDSITDSDNKIPLKGNPYIEDTTLYDKSIKTVWLGKIDIDNVHENYLYSKLQNRNNLYFTQNLKMVIKLKKPNYGLYRFQKVLLELYNNTNTDKENKVTKVKGGNIKEYDITTDVDGDKKSKIIHKLSGEWLITAINFIFDKNGNNQEITLIKRELTEEYTFPRNKKE